MRLHFCIADGDRQGFHGHMIIVIRVFFIFILPLLNETIVFSRLNPLGPYSDPLFKASVNMEDKLPLNTDKFHLCIKLLLKLHTL